MWSIAVNCQNLSGYTHAVNVIIAQRAVLDANFIPFFLYMHSCNFCLHAIIFSSCRRSKYNVVTLPLQDELEAHSAPDALSVCVYYGGNRNSDLRLMAEHSIVLTTYGVLQAAHKAVRVCH
jgi:hypothetical protein